MLTIISGTNRPDSRTAAFARYVQELATSLVEKGENVELIDLEKLDHAYYHPGMYDPKQAPPGFADVYEKKVLPAQKFIILSPEYNGSFPGALKAFLDAVSVRNYDENFTRKPIMLIGVSTGRAGNLRGMDHLADILSHMGGYVIGGKFPISLAQDLLDGDMWVTSEVAKTALAKQIGEFISI